MTKFQTKFGTFFPFLFGPFPRKMGEDKLNPNSLRNCILCKTRLKKVPWRIPKIEGGGGWGHLKFSQTEGDFFLVLASLTRMEGTRGLQLSSGPGLIEILVTAHFRYNIACDMRKVLRLFSSSSFSSYESWPFLVWSAFRIRFVAARANNYVVWGKSSDPWYT